MCSIMVRNFEQRIKMKQGVPSWNILNSHPMKWAVLKLSRVQIQASSVCYRFFQTKSSKKHKLKLHNLWMGGRYKQVDMSVLVYTIRIPYHSTYAYNNYFDNNSPRDLNFLFIVTFFSCWCFIFMLSCLAFD